MIALLMDNRYIRVPVFHARLSPYNMTAYLPVWIVVYWCGACTHSSRLCHELPLPKWLF